MRRTLLRVPEFEYIRARSLDEALDLISKYDDFKLLAGGTDLVVDLKIGRYRPRVIIDIGRLNELKYIEDKGEQIAIGAITTLQEILESSVIRQKLPALAEAVRNIGSWQIRNIATIGGNICNASPAADSAPPLIVYDAKVVLMSKRGKREAPLKEFFLGPRKTMLERDELLAEIIIPYIKDSGQSFLRLGGRAMHTLSRVSVASLVKVEDGRFEDVRVSLGAVAPKPIRARSVEEALIGKRVSYESVKRASEEVIKDISPISDVRASAEYRKKASIVLTRDSIVMSLKRLNIYIA